MQQCHVVRGWDRITVGKQHWTIYTSSHGAPFPHPTASRFAWLVAGECHGDSGPFGCSVSVRHGQASAFVYPPMAPQVHDRPWIWRKGIGVPGSVWNDQSESASRFQCKWLGGLERKLIPLSTRILILSWTSYLSGNSHPPIWAKNLKLFSMDIKNYYPRISGINSVPHCRPPVKILFLPDTAFEIPPTVIVTPLLRTPFYVLLLSVWIFPPYVYLYCAYYLDDNRIKNGPISSKNKLFRVSESGKVIQCHCRSSAGVSPSEVADPSKRALAM